MSPAQKNVLYRTLLLQRERERLFLDSKTEEAEDEDSVIQISSFARLVASNS
jgi:hypothetical protein